MIEIIYVDGKPQVTINKKPVRTWNKLEEENYIYVECDYDDGIIFSDFETIELRKIPKNFVALLLFEKNHPKLYNFDTLTNIQRLENRHFYITFSGNMKSEIWDMQYFYPVFETQGSKISDERCQIHCDYDDYENVFFNCTFYIEKSIEHSTIGDLLEIGNKKISLAYQKTFQELNENFIKDKLLDRSLSLSFKFSPQLKDICKQYLSYFGKFLSDNDIECELSLIDKDGITYMTINVDESKIDIEKLKQALVGYFTLPIVKQENISFEIYNIATQQLIANIEHLKSQLRLANLTIAQYENNSLVNSPKPVEYVFIDSLDEESKVKLFDGLVEIGKTAKFKFFGIEIGFSIPKLIDKFKNNSEDIN